MGSSSSDDDGRGRSAAAGADGGGAVVVVGGGGGGGGKHGRLKSVCWSESRERGKRESARERLQTEASLASRESEWCKHEIQGESAKRELPHNCSSQPELQTAAATASRAR